MKTFINKHNNKIFKQQSNDTSSAHDTQINSNATADNVTHALSKVNASQLAYIVFTKLKLLRQPATTNLRLRLHCTGSLCASFDNSPLQV